jgi:hypothetical protein
LPTEEVLAVMTTLSHAVSAEAPQGASPGDAAGITRSRKKNAPKTLASLFSSLLDKARAASEGGASASARQAETAAEKKSALSASASQSRVPASETGLKGAEAEKRIGERAAKTPIDRLSSRLRDGSAAESAAAADRKPERLDLNAAASSPRLAETAKTAPEDAEPQAKAEKKGQRRNAGAAAELGVGEHVAAAVAAGAQAAAGSVRAAAAPAAQKSSEPVEGVDAKKKDKRKERIEIEVYDQRKGDGGAQAAGLSGQGASEASKSASDSLSGPSADLTLSLREGSGRSDGASDSAGAKASGQGSFADALSRELREAYNAEIVQRAAVVLKDGGEGLIRLALKPEALGAVKIRLELADNRVAGRIVVESDEALKAFSKELKSLEQAFVDGGFDGASIELALSSGGGGDSSAGSRGRTDDRPFFSDRLIASEYGSAVADIEPIGFPAAVWQDSRIDMLA